MNIAVLLYTLLRSVIWTFSSLLLNRPTAASWASTPIRTVITTAVIPIMISAVIMKMQGRIPVYEEFLRKFDTSQEYQQTIATHTRKRPISLDHFFKYWNKKLKHIRLEHAKTDVCDVFTKFQRWRQWDSLRFHQMDVELEKNVFLRNLEFTGNPSNNAIFICVNYSQSVRLPLLTESPKQLFFKSGKIVDISGIANMTEIKQTTFLLPQGGWPRSKGIIGVISMLHYYLCI